MVTPKDSRVKGITEKKEVLSAIEKGLGKENFNKELHEFIYSLYTMVNENIGINNDSVRNVIKYQLILKNMVNSEIEDIDKKIEIENKNFDNLKNQHEVNLSNFLKSKNELKNLLKNIENDIERYDENIKQNENLKKATLSKILMDYHNNNLDSNILKNELKDSFYRFTNIKEFKEYAIPLLKKNINQYICCKPKCYLDIESRDLRDVNGVEKEYIMLLDENVINTIDGYCYDLIRIGF